MAKKKKKKFLNIDSEIVISDAKRIKKKLPLIKSKNGLAKYIYINKLYLGSETAILTKLYRYEKDGGYNLDQALIRAIVNVLDTTEKKLVKKL